MPTYDYLCDTCGNRFEEWQKITDEPTRICPTCGSPVHRVIYPVGLVFKGGGFYKTDNRAAPPAESSAGKATESGAGTEKGADASGGSGTDAGGSDGKTAAAKSGDAGASKSSDTAPAGATAKSE